MLVVCLIKEKYIGLVAVGVSLVISLLLLVMVLSYRKKNYSYLYIYDNKIIVKCYGKNEMIIDITPCEYFIRILKPSFFNLKYGLTLEFQDKKYNVLLKYKSLTLYPSEKNKESKKWEEDIFSIGCKVVDRDNLIINK